MSRRSIPHVTVAIPTRDRAALLRQSLLSVLEQSLSEIEVVVCDNASSDATAEIVQSFDDPRITYIRHERDIGLYANHTFCLGVGRGRYVAILQDDDLMLPDNLERKARVLDEHPKVGVVHSAFRLIGSDGRILKERDSWVGHEGDIVESGTSFIEACIARSENILLSAALIRRSWVREHGFEEFDEGYCDMGFWLRLARRADVAYVHEPLAAFRIHEGSASMNSGLHEIVDGSVRTDTMEQIKGAQLVKRRFMGTHAGELAEVRRLRSMSRETARRRIFTVIRRTGPGRSPLVIARLILKAGRIEPTVFIDARTVRLLLGSVLGARGRAIARRIAGHPGTELPGHRKR